MKTLNHYSRTYLLILTIALLTHQLTYSQGVGINDDGSMPVDGAILDIKSTTGGLLIPRMTEAQRDAITPDTQSMLIYQTNNDSGFYYYDGTIWTPFLIGGGAANSGWETKGNTGTTPANNFIGTTDSVDWVIRTDSTEQIRVMANGNVGIGTTSPTAKFHVSNTNPSNTIASLSNFTPVLSANYVGNLHSAWNHLALSSAFNYTGDFYGAVNRTSVEASQTGTVSNVTGAINDIYHYGAGNVADARGTIGAVINSSAGTIASAYGVFADVQNIGGGNITNGYGLWIDDVQATNKWSIYANDATAPSYLAGSLGLGINTPTAKLHILDGLLKIQSTSDPALFERYGADSNGPAIFLHKSRNATIGSHTIVQDEDFLGGLYWSGSDGSGFVRAASIYAQVDETPGANDMPGALLFNTTADGASSESIRMIIKNDGNVGIGTSGPNYKLDVNGNAAFGDATAANFISIRGKVAAGNLGSLIAFDNTAEIAGDVSRIMYNTGNNGFLFDHNDLNYFCQIAPTKSFFTSNLGIGIATPSSGLHVSKSTGGASANWYDPANYAATIHQDANATQRYGLLVSDRWRAAENFVFAVDGRTTVGGGTVAEDTHSPYFIVRGDGNVGIGTTAPSHLLHVTGIARSTQTTWATTSDKRVKTKIVDLQEGLNTILKIRPVEFEYTKKYQKYNEGYEGKKRGFIAQEVKEVLPEMVTVISEKVGNDLIKDFHLLSNSDFTPMLVKAIQEQQQLIEKLKTENKMMKAEKASQTDMEQLKNENELLQNRLKKVEELLEIKAKK